MICAFKVAFCISVGFFFVDCDFPETGELLERGADDGIQVGLSCYWRWSTRRGRNGVRRCGVLIGGDGVDFCHDEEERRARGGGKSRKGRRRDEGLEFR